MERAVILSVLKVKGGLHKRTSNGCSAPSSSRESQGDLAPSLDPVVIQRKEVFEVSRSLSAALIMLPGGEEGGWGLVNRPAPCRGLGWGLIK